MNNRSPVTSYKSRVAIEKSKARGRKSEKICFLFSVFCLLSSVCFSQDSSSYISKARVELGEKNFKAAYEIMDECIKKFSAQADSLAKYLEDFPAKGKEGIYQVMNDVAVCYFIKGETLIRERKIEEAKKVFRKVIEKYPYAQAWDPRGWFWSIREKAEITIKKWEVTVIKQDFSGIIEDIDTLFKDLEEKGYISENGLIQGSFYALKSFSEMVLASKFESKKNRVYDIFQAEITSTRTDAVVVKQNFSEIVDNPGELFNNLIENAYINGNGRIRGRFYGLKNASGMVVASKFESAKEKIYTIFQRAAGEIEEEVIITKVILNDEGSEFPVNYEEYGKFENAGTSEYIYRIDKPVELTKAVGEGICPNTTSVKFDPNFVKIRKELVKVDHWEIINSRDLSTAFYKWCMAPEPPGVRQFYIGDILERSGLIKQAVKAYHAVLVHFPKTVAWTYWETPWYVGKAALYRIKFLLKEHPELNLELKDAYFKIENGTDNDIRNDIFIVHPGRLKNQSFKDKVFPKHKVRNFGRIIKTQGTGKIKLIKYESGDWQLLVDDKPFMIQGLTYSPTRVGESPDEGTLADWTIQDVNNNNIIDAPYEVWVDKNRNNVQDKDEKRVGDFYLMKEMGVNCIRLYHQPFEPNKKLLKDMYENYGIYVAMSDFLGKYAIGSGADWDPGTDYDNPVHRENMLKSVRGMVEDFKDEPYVLIWILGNENIYGLACNADKKPASFFKFANECAKLIKDLDPLKRPVAIASGDSLYLYIFGEECPDIDIFGTNSYRGKHGFLDLWSEVKELSGKAAMITEYGCPSHATGYTREEAEDFQAEYHRNTWLDIYNHRCGYGDGNVLGGFVFEWLDEWWKAYEPSYHDKKGLFKGPFLDGAMHEEWLGICGQGNGKDSPFLRQLKKAYFTYKTLWTKDK